VVIEAQINQVVLVSRCRDTTVQVSGKANAISVENAPRLSLLVDSLVASVDVVKSPSFALQVLGTLPTILLDQVDGATIYLGADSLATEVFSSKCTGINVNVPLLPPPRAVRGGANGGRHDNDDDDDDDDEDDEDVGHGGAAAAAAAAARRAGDAGDDYVECAVPEQIKSFVRNGRLVSEIVEHAG
jgi:adenylyl cyclase-associated protein